MNSGRALLNHGVAERKKWPLTPFQGPSFSFSQKLQDQILKAQDKTPHSPENAATRRRQPGPSHGKKLKEGESSSTQARCRSDAAVTDIINAQPPPSGQGSALSSKNIRASKVAKPKIAHSKREIDHAQPSPGIEGSNAGECRRDLLAMRENISSLRSQVGIILGVGFCATCTHARSLARSLAYMHAYMHIQTHFNTSATRICCISKNDFSRTVWI